MLMLGFFESVTFKFTKNDYFPCMGGRMKCKLFAIFVTFSIVSPILQKCAHSPPNDQIIY
jgi:hypothetical protein